jgi:hypothetical protein
MKIYCKKSKVVLSPASVLHVVPGWCMETLLPGEGKSIHPHKRWILNINKNILKDYCLTSILAHG